MKPILQIVLLVVVAIAAFQLGRSTVPATREPQSEHVVEELIESLKKPDWLERTHRFSGLVRELSAPDMDAVLRAVEEGEIEPTQDERRLLLHSWARLDAQSAFQYALFSGDSDQRWMLGEVIYAWAYEDPQGAQVALLGLQNTDQEKFLVSRLVAGWFRGSSSGSARNYVEGMPSGPVQDAAIGSLAQAMANNDASELRNWADRLISEPGNPITNVVFVQAASVLAKNEPEETAQWVRKRFGMKDASGAARAVARRWLESDPNATFEWLSSLPAGDERREATEFIFAYWLKNRPKLAEEWLADAVPDTALDPAMEFMARTKLQSDPVVAIKWARHIADMGARERMLVKIGSQWYRSDPEAASRWLKESSLPRAARNAIVKSVR